MKWTLHKLTWIVLLILILSIITNANVVGGFLPINGGKGQNKYAIVCGPPLYDYFTGCNQDMSVYIVHPANGTNLYWGLPSITENVTITIIGNSPASCAYKLNDGNWTDFDVCALGENASWVNAVTMPEGYPVTLTVNITDNCGNYIINQSEFNVYYRNEYINGPDNFIIFISGIFLLVFTLVVGQRKYNGKEI